jgi:hypothetical protein
LISYLFYTIFYALTGEGIFLNYILIVFAGAIKLFISTFGEEICLFSFFADDSLDFFCVGLYFP